MRRQRMPIGHEKQARQFGLQLDPVLQGAVVMAQMQRARGRIPETTRSGYMVVGLQKKKDIGDTINCSKLPARYITGAIHQV